MPKLLLHFEGIAVAAAGLWEYHHLGASWILFAALILVPDLSMLGYLAGPVSGARLYNLGHTYLLPGLLWLCLSFLAPTIALPVALIWTIHIGIDRALGFGLKYESGFKDTHLNRV